MLGLISGPSYSFVALDTARCQKFSVEASPDTSAAKAAEARQHAPLGQHFDSLSRQKCNLRLVP